MRTAFSCFRSIELYSIFILWIVLLLARAFLGASPFITSKALESIYSRWSPNGRKALFSLEFNSLQKNLSFRINLNH